MSQKTTLSPITLHHGNEVLQELRLSGLFTQSVELTQDEGYRIDLGCGFIVTIYESGDVYGEVDIEPGYEHVISMLFKISKALKNRSVYWSFPDNGLHRLTPAIASHYQENSIEWEDDIDYGALVDE
jgi:hypothetical protein